MGASGSKGCCGGNADENNTNEVEFQDNEKNDLGELTKRDDFPSGENAKSNNIINDSIEYVTRVNRLKEVVNTAPILKLKIISSSTLPKGMVLSINAQCLENSFRNSKDGYTFFGCKKKDKKANKNTEPQNFRQQSQIINDFIIPSQDKEISKRHRGRHFQIEYDIDAKAYKIKDLGIGFGAFYKLDFPLVFF